MARKKSAVSEADRAAFDAVLIAVAQRFGISKSELIEVFSKWLTQELKLAAPVAKELGVSKYIIGDLWTAMRLASGRLLTEDDLSVIQSRGGISELEVRRVYRELRRRPIPSRPLNS